MPDCESESYEHIQKVLAQRDRLGEYLTDSRDAVEGDVTDSDQEFESILDLDALLRSLLQFQEDNIRDQSSLATAHE